MALVQGITSDIRAVLRDAGQDIYLDSDIHGAILEAEKVVVIYRPDASAVSADVVCIAGTIQSIGGLTPEPSRLMSVKYNRNDGVDGRSIRRILQGDLDAINPTWRSDAGSTVVREYMTDDKEPLIFYVNPPALIGASVRVSYSSVPPAYGTVNSGTTTTVSDLYSPMLIEWALYRLFGHDTEGSVNASRSQQHLQVFGSMMGIKFQSDTRSSPKVTEPKQ